MTNKTHNYDWDAMWFYPDEDVIEFAFIWYKTPQGGPWWADNKCTPEGQAEFARMKRLYAEDMAAKEGPVRTVTRKEIVPGVYGLVCVSTRMNDIVHIGIGGKMGSAYVNDYGAKCHEMTQEDLTDAIETLIQIRDALENNA